MVDVHDVEMAGAKAVAVRLEAWGVTSRVATATAETRCRIRLKDIMFGSRLVVGVENERQRDGDAWMMADVTV